MLQIQAGLAHLGWFEPSAGLLVVLVLGITAIGTISVITGLHRGLRWLSNANMTLAGVMALAVLLIGPSVYLLRSFVQNGGEYLQTIPELAFVTGADANDGWTLGWTLFNQAWFLAWAPFVGMFIARISRGRTIREFTLGALLAPTLVSLVWFTIFGSSGLYYHFRDGNLVGDGETVDSDTALFLLFNELPTPELFVSVLAVIAILVITLFFVTSADSCSMVVDVLSHGGRSTTPRATRAFWALLLGASGALLLMAGGKAALTVLQVSSLAGAAPLSLVYLLAMVALFRMFRHEMATMPRYVRIRSQATPSALLHTARQNAETEEDMEQSLRELLRNQHGNAATEPTGRRRLQGASATLAGLNRRAEAGPTRGTTSADATVVAVHEVPPQATAVDPRTGSIIWDQEAVYTDPTAGEIFHTPEFDESAAGAELRSREYLNSWTDTTTGRSD